MPSLTVDLAALLSTVRRPGDFVASGTTELLAPLIEVDGVGPIALPLLPVQAEQLVGVAERAPYGRGPETIIDATTRRTWQIAANRVHIRGRHWQQTLDGILARVAAGLGVSEPVSADLYKLLLYGPGDFFVSHRDTEKAPGMFATLVIALPSFSSGGELIVRHKEREVQVDLSSEEPSEVTFAAFYADCPHEVRPVAAGHRLVLVYNLLRPWRGPLPMPPDHDRETARAAALLKGWARARRGPEDEAPEKLIYPLEHAYTLAELGFAALKGADAAVAGVLAAAAQQADCDLNLALVVIEESGPAEYAGSYRRRWSEPDEDEFEVIEVSERSAVLTNWRSLDGTPTPLGDIPVEDEDVAPPGALDDLEPDEEHFLEATGNEGASFERTYRRAALVLWPRTGFLAVLSQAGLATTLPYLETLTARWEAAGGDRRSPLWQQAHELSKHMLARWAGRDWPGHGRAPSDTARMLGLLSRLADAPRIAAALEGLAARGGFSKEDADAIIGAAGVLAPKRANALIARLIAARAGTSLDACGALLARAATAWPPERQAGLIDVATILVDALPGDPARAVPRDLWSGGVIPVSPGFVVDLLTALGAIDSALAARAGAYLLACPATYHVDRVLVPAVIKLVAAPATRGMAAVERLRDACLTHLRARIAEPLEAPQDWRRKAARVCSCPHCRDLDDFLEEPTQKVWVFKAAEPLRSHVEGTIQRARSDVDVTTDRRGRPYRLVATKNQASYERRVRQRKHDLENVARLQT